MDYLELVLECKFTSENTFSTFNKIMPLYILVLTSIKINYPTIEHMKNAFRRYFP